jgi:Zn-finger nucleic acid-binding protein
VSLACPRCSQGLIRYACADVELVRCWGGHGVWIDNALSQRLASGAFPRAVVDELSKLEAHAARPDDARAPGACPQCRKQLQGYVVDIAGLAVDVCQEHGTWLDTGELARVARGETAASTSPATARAVLTPAMTEQESRENTRRLEALVSPPDEGVYAKGLRVMPGAILTAVVEGMTESDESEWDSYDEHGEFGPGSDLLTRVFGVIAYLVRSDD